MSPDVRRFERLDELSREAAHACAEVMGDAVSKHGRCAIALAGGETPTHLYQLLASDHSGRIDWIAVTRRALQWRTGSFTYVPLVLSRELLGAPVPDHALDDLAATSFDRRIVRAAAQVLAQHPRDASLFPDFFDLMWSRSMGERRRVLTKLFSRDVVARRYGISHESARVWLRYPQRLGYLCRSYGPELARFLRFGRGAHAHAYQRFLLTRFLRPLETMKRPGHTERG